MTRVRDVMISAGLPCLGGLLLVAHAAAAQTCTQASTAAGTLDTCFGADGHVQIDVTGTGAFQYASVVRVQPDGFIVIGGASRVAGSTGTELMLARYLPDGSALDASFGTGGVVKTRLTSLSTDSEGLKDLAIDSAGRVVVAAQMPPASKKGVQTFAVLRYSPNGTLDATFASNGLVSFGFSGGTDAWVRTLAVDASDRIIVAGNSGTALVAARLTQAGTFDQTFGSGGKATITSIVDRRMGPSIYGMTLDAAGKAVLVGSLYQKSLIVRLTSGGSLDASFASKGWTTIDYAGGQDDYFMAVAIDSAGRIVAAGRADTPGNRAPPLTDMGLARFLPSGVLDTTFGTGGKVMQDINGTFDVIHGLAIQADGRIIVCAEATATDYSTADTVVSRFTANGPLDATFGAAGFTHTDFAGAYTYPYNLVVQNDGGVTRVIVVSDIGHSTSIGLTRYFE